MHFYGMSNLEVMALPIKLFWLMDACIDRIKAQDDKRTLHIAALSAMDTSSVSRLAEIYDTETGEVVKTKFDPIGNAVRDEEGVKRLMALAGTRAGAVIKG